MSGEPIIELRDVSLTLPKGQIGGGTLRGATLRPLLNLFSRTPQPREEIVILDQVNFSARPGDRIGLLGLNGAGKTSLLKVLAGIYPPSRGEIRHEGQVGTLLSLNAGFDPEATGRENTFLQGLTMGYRLKQMRARLPEIEAFADIGEYFDLPVRTYSSGMLVRLGFAIATAFDPDILIMDEWLSVGDERFAEKAEARLSRVVDRAHILVLATHNPMLLERICNRVLVIHHGRIAYDGDVAGALERYRAL